MLWFPRYEAKGIGNKRKENQISSKNSPGHNTGVGSLSLLQGIFPTRYRTQVSCIAGGFFTSWALREAHWYQKNTGVGSYFLLQGIFLTQGSNLHPCTAGGFFNSWATWEAQNDACERERVLFDSLWPHGL